MQEFWSGLPFPSPGDLPDPGIETASLAAPVLAGGFLTTEPWGKPQGEGKWRREASGETDPANTLIQDLQQL